jgi:hypothetical protein
LPQKAREVENLGGFRVITYYLHKTADKETLYLVTLYDKSEEASISKSELEKLVRDYLESE